jgi:hypothetical protein
MAAVVFSFLSVKKLYMQSENQKAIITSEIIKNIGIRNIDFYKDKKYYNKFSKKYFSDKRKNEAVFTPTSQLYYLQIATFLNVENAMSFQKKFGNFDLRIVEVNNQDKRHYIIISNYFDSKEKALELAKSFKRYSPILRER